MKVRQRARMNQERRWRPSLSDIMFRTIRKRPKQIAESLSYNAFVDKLTAVWEHGGSVLWSHANDPEKW